MSTAERYKKVYSVTWDQLHRDARALAWRLLEKGPFKSVVAITRGGLVPAAIIARELDVRLVDTICVATYQFRDQATNISMEEALLKKPTVSGEGILVIDDMADTGRTARLVRELLPQAYFAAVYAKPEGRPLLDSFITEVSQDTWILLPWDSEIQYTAPLFTTR